MTGGASIVSNQRHVNADRSIRQARARSHMNNTWLNERTARTHAATGEQCCVPVRQGARKRNWTLVVGGGGPITAQSLKCRSMRGRRGFNSYGNRVYFDRAAACPWRGLCPKLSLNSIGLGQKKGEGVAATLPRKERRTLWKASRTTSSTPHPPAYHRFPAAKVFVCDHVVKPLHVGRTR